MLSIKEELLHHVWQHRLFNQVGLTTTDGQMLDIVKVGKHNLDAGPDFQNVRIKLDATEWAGNMEIHVRSSDWLKHGHQHNPNYANIVLHVVFIDDLKESLGNFPTLELRHLVSDQVLKRYENLIQSSEELPCGKQILGVPELIRTAWLESLLVARLQHKSGWMNHLIDEYKGDLEQAFTAVLFSSFGMKVNAEPFEQLARLIHWKVLAKHQDSLFQLEALLFGVAGFLETPQDEYQNALRREFDFLAHKYQLSFLEISRWKFLRMRPANMPTIRLAQLASLFNVIGPFLKWFSNQQEIDLIQIMVTPSEYWDSHYRFGLESKSKPKRLGKTAAHNIIINAVVPFLLVLSQREAKPKLQNRALELLEQLKAESNVTVNLFRKYGLKVKSAAVSQALIELKTNYCDHKKCLTCNIGANILKRES